MFVTSFLFVVMILSINDVLCDKVITIDMGDNATTDLKSYVNDLHVAISSVQYTADLSARMVNDLMDRLRENHVDCKCEEANNYVKQIWRNDYQRTSRTRAHKLHIEPLKWNDARKFCRQEGGELASVDNIDEAQILAKVLTESQAWSTKINDTKSAFIGVHSFFEPNDWITLNGKSVRVQTSSSTIENKCVILTMRGDLEATSCNEPHPYFCQLQAN